MPRVVTSNVSSGRVVTRQVGGEPSKPKPKKPRRWIGALVDNIEDFARGVGPGAVHIARSIYNDVDLALTGESESNSFMLDDVGRAIKNDYATRYGDLGDAINAAARGEFGKSIRELGQFRDQVATKPLDFILDAATIATLGGASVGTVPAKLTIAGAKATQRAGRGAQGAALLERSGSLRRAGYVNATPENVKRASQVYGVSSREVRGTESIGLVRGVREVGTKAAAEGRIKEPLLRPRRTNAWLNSRDEIVERAIGSTHLLNKAPVVGLYTRAARQSAKAPMLERSILERQVDDAQKRLQWLKQDELTAWAALHQNLDVEQYAQRLDEEAPALAGVELELNRARAAQLRKPEVQQLVARPSTRVRKAVEATKALADDVMQPIMENVIGMRREDLLERRALPERVAAGATTTRTHPQDLQPTKDARAAQRAAGRVARRRDQLRRQVVGDLERMRAEREQLAERLRRVAQELTARGRAADAAKRELRTNDQDTMRERPMTRDEALEQAPERVEQVPMPGREPSPADVERMIARMRNRLLRGKHRVPRGELRRFLAGVYNEMRYGTPTPGAAAKRAEAAMAARSKAARAKRQRSIAEIPGRGDMLKAIDKHGAWSTRAASMAEGAGPHRAEYWKMVKDARGDDARFVQQWPDGSLARTMAERGFHPTDRSANPENEADVLADVVEEWLGEQVGQGTDASVADVARGVGGELSGALDIDDAQALIAEARFGNRDLPADPTDEEIAEGIALAHLPAEDTITQAEWVERAMHAFLSVFENYRDHVPDPDAEFGRVRGRADLELAEKLGIGSRADGVEPDGEAWAAGIERKLTELGFTDEYRRDAASITQAQRNAAELGAFMFRDDRFVPDPDQVDFGTLLEFVPELSPELRTKLEQQAQLTPREKATLRLAARKLEAAAKRVERNGQQEAVLRRRVQTLSQPNARERALLEQAEELEPMPLRGETAPDGTKYRQQEWVNPESGALYRDEGTELAPGGSYLPHVMPRGRSLGGGGMRADGAVRNRPNAPAGYTKQSTGQLFARGTYENEAIALLERARGLIRAKYAGDLFDVSVRDMGIPYDEAQYVTLGGPREWIIANPQQIRGVERQVESLAGMFEELRGLLPEEQFATTIEKLRDASGATLRDALDTGRTDELVMIPRAYYQRLVGDLKQSHWLTRALVDRPLDVFRSLVLFSRPAYYANNIVGQHLMLAVRDPGFVPTYIRHVARRNQSAARELFRLASDPRSSAAMWDAVFEKHGKALVGASAGQVETSGMGALTQRMALSGSRKQQIIAAMLRSPRTANELGAILSDDIPRQVRFVRLMQPHIRAAREAGETGDDAEIAMRLLDADDVLRERVTDQTLFDLVDYRNMSPVEKRVVRRIIPFYGWMRGLTVWAAELGYNHPGTMLGINAVSTVGQDVANVDWNERVPSWLQGAVLVGDEQDGMQRIVNTQGLNPLSTLADVSMLARGAFGDDPTRSLAASSTFGQINPYLQTFAASAFNQGKELGTPFPMLMPGQHLGQPAEDRQQWRGWLLTGLGGFAASTPQAQLYAQRAAQRYNEQTLGRSVVSPTGVYQSPLSDYVYSYLGAPVRNVSIERARARLERDEALLAGDRGGAF